MWPYYPELLDRPVPRYTSYPTAAEFGEVNGDFHELGFASLTPGEPLSLYVHIPFCEKICWYCGCNTGAANKARRLTGYLESLHREIELIAEKLPSNCPVGRIAFGGGSPNALGAVDFVRLVDHLMIAFQAFEATLSVELDPRSLSPEWFAAIGRLGIGHASLGVQSFDPELQARIGRIQPVEMVARSVEQLRKAGVRSLNFDLMYGLPGQDLDRLAETIEQAIALDPDRIALFGYAHLPSVIKRQRCIDASDMPDQRERFEMAELGHAMLTAAGYEPVGFDHFARPQDGLAKASRQATLRRNFQGFTDDDARTLIGLGASAISQFPDRFVQNAKNSGTYRIAIDADRLAGERGIAIGADDRLRGDLISGLLCAGRCRPPQDVLGPDRLALIETLSEMGLVRSDGSEIALTEAGRPYARMIASQFDAYRSGLEMRFSSAV